MNSLFRVACLGLLSLIHAPAQKAFQCGNLHQPACQHSDWARMNLAPGENRACEIDLTEVEGHCLNNQRNLQGVRRSQWAAWALEHQLLGIGGDTPLNFLTWPAALAAYANPQQGFQASLAQQSLSLTGQLHAGARLLDIDVRSYAAAGSGEALRLCRAPDGSACAQLGNRHRLFGYALQEVASWVDANPGQVVFIRLRTGQISGQQLSLVYDEVQLTLGNRIYEAPITTPLRWPTPGELRGSGKRVLVAHFDAPSNVATATIWAANGLEQLSDRVMDQNFEGCVAHDGMDLAQRGSMKPLSWWNVAEAPNGGLLDGLLVRKAVRCGVASAGLQQIAAGGDGRLAAMVWSWAEGDWGRNGAALLNREGRWTSTPESQPFAVACALRRDGAKTLQNRAWRITLGTAAWSPAAGDALCVSEHGANYTFAAPENSYQNHALATLAAGRQIWLRYKAAELPSLSLSARKLVFRMNPGDPPPAAQSLVVGATEGTPIAFRVEPGLPVVIPVTSTSMPAGNTTLPISFGKEVSALAPGVYRSNLLLTTGGRTTAVEVELTVRAAPQITITVDPATSQVGKQVTLRLDVTGGRQPGGEYLIYRMRQGVLETVARGVLTPMSSTAAVAKPIVPTLEVGTHTLLAMAAGDARNLPASALPFTITTRLVANPAAIDWKMFSNETLPVRDVMLTGLGASPVVTASCWWLKASIVGTALRVQGTEELRQLALGTHRCEVFVTDQLTTLGLGRLVLPVSLLLQASLTAQPNGPILLVGDATATTTLQLSTSEASGVDITATASVPWLQVVPLGTMRAPGAFRLVVAAGTLPWGRHLGEIVFRSAVTPEVRLPVTFDRVKPTVIDTAPDMRFIVDGTVYQGTASFYWSLGSVHQLVLLPSATETERQVPYGWETVGGLRLGATRELRATAEGGWVTGHFQTWFRLRHSAGPGGTIAVTSSVPPDGEFYRSGANVELTTRPQIGFQFGIWNVNYTLGSFTSNEDRVRLAVFSPIVATAQFQAQAAQRVDILANGPGVAAAIDGVVTMLPATFYWYPRSAHTLFATGTVSISTQSQLRFTRWTTGVGLIQQVVMPNAPLRVEALYQREHLVTATAAPAAGGIVRGWGWYPEGEKATLEAVPSTGFRFVEFTGSISSLRAATTVTVTGPLQMAARFDPEPVVAPVAPTGGLNP